MANMDNANQPCVQGHPSLSTNGTRSQRSTHGKRPIDDDGSGGQDNNRSKIPRNNEEQPRIPVETQFGVPCPFSARYPYVHDFLTCPRFAKIKNFRDHLKKKHDLENRCPHCLVFLENEKNWHDHTRGHKCRKMHEEVPGMTRTQVDEIQDLTHKGLKTVLSLEEYFRKVFDILFDSAYCTCWPFSTNVYNSHFISDPAFQGLVSRMPGMESVPPGLRAQSFAQIFLVVGRYLNEVGRHAHVAEHSGDDVQFGQSTASSSGEQAPQISAPNEQSSAGMNAPLVSSPSDLFSPGHGTSAGETCLSSFPSQYPPSSVMPSQAASSYAPPGRSVHTSDADPFCIDPSKLYLSSDRLESSLSNNSSSRPLVIATELSLYPEEHLEGMNEPSAPTHGQHPSSYPSEHVGEDLESLVNYNSDDWVIPGLNDESADQDQFT